MAWFRTLTLSDSERQTLVEARAHHPAPAVGERAAALLKIADGRRPHWVARHGLLRPRHPDTVYGWLTQYQRFGLAGILGFRHGGPRRRSPFDPAALQVRLEQAPPCLAGSTIPPSRWTLRSIRAAIPALAGYSLSGVWRVMQRLRIGERMTGDQQFSPDPDYQAKLAFLLACLEAAAGSGGRIRVLFMDQMGYTRWPEPGPTWAAAVPAPAPVTARQGSKQQLWRLVGALDALSGQVHYRENYIVGRRQVIAFYHQLDQAYPDADRLYVVQDNWSIHRHADVEAALTSLPRITPIFLPTYAPWLNPIEKLWRWLRQMVLRNHRLAGDWAALRQRVNAFLDQFAAGSEPLLRYVGLRGAGRLAHALTPP